MVRIVYAGLLGVPQGVLDIIEHVDFKALDAELHVYGGGNQKEAIKRYIVNHADGNIFFHGYVEAHEMNGVLSQYDASLIPLVTYIKGAVPSKIFDTMPLGLPILFCGEGEGAAIVRKYQLGFVSRPKDYDTLAQNIRKLSLMSEEERQRMAERGREASKGVFNFNRQMDDCYKFIFNIVNDEKVV